MLSFICLNLYSLLFSVIFPVSASYFSSIIVFPSSSFTVSINSSSFDSFIKSSSHGAVFESFGFSLSSLKSNSFYYVQAYHY